MAEIGGDDNNWPPASIVETELTSGQRFERSLLGETVISGMVVLIILIGVVWNLPDSDLKRRLMPTLVPIASTTALEQRWQMYAPEPISRLETVEVHVTMADGADRVWSIQRGHRFAGQFTWYHWQKLKEQTVREPPNRAGIAHWVVDQLTEPSEKAVRVRMILRTEELPPPGQEGSRTTAAETLYDEDLTGPP